MRFGRTLRKTIYPPWKDQYIDYDKLKRLLKESESRPSSPIGEGQEDDETWTEEDESKFVEELINVQLEKVHEFQAKTYQTLRDRTSECEKRLERLAKAQEPAESAAAEGERSEESKPQPSPEEKEKILRQTLQDLDQITKEVNELEKYSRINYTGFLKAAKKHDRKRGQDYKIRPLLQVRLSALPINNEDYNPLLYRLSMMYSFVRQRLDNGDRGRPISEPPTGAGGFTSHKFWVHPENLLEVKTIILRRLPVLIYNPQTSKVAEGTQIDPSITSIYFDNPKFRLYTDKVMHQPDASSLRLRWYGQLSEHPEIVLEKKVMKEGDASEEKRFPIKEKYVAPFIKGEYHMERSIEKLQGKEGQDRAKAEKLQEAVDDIAAFVKDNDLQPVLRANYSRTAFQIPGDDRVRISIDTNLALIREDAIDMERPCRDPDDWHRRDIDDNNMTYPFKGIRKGEIEHFPYALMEIKIKDRKQYEWVTDLMNSHLVKEAPRFSKFVHGVATLFEDYVNSFPFWLSAVETDIRRDPHQAFIEEQERAKKAAEDEFTVGSLFGGARSSPAFRQAISSPVGSPAHAGAASTTPRLASGKATVDMARRASLAAAASSSQPQQEPTVAEPDDDEDGTRLEGAADPSAATAPTNLSGLRALFPSFSTSKYARAHRRRGVALPPGVRDPGVWIKDQGPVRVEAKVWLANQRTFVKWQHVAVLLASLSLGLYNAAGAGAGNGIARALALVYIGFAVFAAVWGWAVYVYRSRLIERRSGRDFDFVLGPCVVCVGLAVALLLNFGFKWRAAVREGRVVGMELGVGNGTLGVGGMGGGDGVGLEMQDL